MLETLLLSVITVNVLLLLQWFRDKLGLHNLALRNVVNLHHVLSLELSGDRNADHGRLKVACLRQVYWLNFRQVEVLGSIGLSLGDFLSILISYLALMELDFNPSLSL